MKKEVYVVAIGCNISIPEYTNFKESVSFEVYPSIFTTEKEVKNYIQKFLKLELEDYATEEDITDILDNVESEKLFKCYYDKEFEGIKGRCNISFDGCYAILKINIQTKFHHSIEFTEYRIKVYKQTIDFEEENRTKSTGTKQNSYKA